MRTFNEIAEELGLKKFLASRCGTLHFVPSAKGSQRVIVRHFDRDLPASMITSYVELIRRCKLWIEGRPELARLIKIDEPFEVGQDFYARTHHTYYISLSSYTTDEDAPEPPPELAEMHLELQNAFSSHPDSKDRIVEQILRRSLLEPSTKTWFAEDIEKFIVVEPRILPEDVWAWSQQSQ